MQAAHDYELSVMEDLDPEPAARATSVRAREVVLGVLLLVGVLGWAGWQWWYGESLRRSYELGSRAVIEQRWEDAMAYFGAAGEYKDASTRAEEAEKKIEERDEQYGLASSRLDAGEWAAALKAAQQAEGIQPGYKDIEALVTSAEGQVYREALSGTIAMRLRDDPGLYYRGADRWTRLEGSDRWSDVRTYSPDGTALYDVPGPGWLPQPSPTPGEYMVLAPGDPTLAGRRLMAASFQDSSGPQFHQLSLAPERYNFYVAAEAGVWGIRIPPPKGSIAPIMPAEGWLPGYEIDYEAYGSSLTSTISIAPNMVVTDLGAKGRHVLLAELDRLAPDRGRARLYLAGPDGSQPRLVYTTTSAIKNARISPDERYALVITVDHIEEARGVMAVVLLDLEGKAPPRTLVENSDVVYASDTWQHINETLGVSATFLYRGYFSSKVLFAVTSWDFHAQRYVTNVKMIDLEHPDWSLSVAQMPAEGQRGRGLRVYEQADGKALVIYANADRTPYLPGTPVTSTLSIIKYAERQAPYTYVPVQVVDSPYAFLAPPQRSGLRPNFSSFMVAGERLVYRADSVYYSDYTTTLYNLPLSELGKKEPTRTAVFSATWTTNGAPPQSCIAVPSMFVYTDEGNVLHARTYDGDIDVVLERGVSFLRSNSNSSYYLSWLR